MGNRTVLALLMSAVVAACVVQQQPQPQPAGGTGGTDTYASDCGAACEHYLACKGIDDQAQWSQCTNECQSSTELDPAVVAEYPQYDCATAIQLVEGGGGGEVEGGTEGSGTCNADCTSCVWDGSSCYSNSMAAMGTVIECEACCCAPGGPAPRWD